MSDLAPYRALIESALAYAGETHTFEDVVQMVVEGRAVFWPGVKSCVVTELDVQPRQTVLHFFLAAGDMAELRAVEPVILAWGTSRGCTLARFVGRRGWERTWMREAGWSNTGVIVMEKPIHG